MTIRPPQSGQTPRPAITRAKSTTVPGTPQRPADTATPAASSAKRDAVQISPHARALQQADGPSREEAGAIEPERMREILGRMSDGHYDRPEVLEAVLERIADEL